MKQQKFASEKLKEFQLQIDGLNSRLSRFGATRKFLGIELRLNLELEEY